MENNIVSTDNIELFLEELSEILGKTLGPYGGTTIIEDSFAMNHFITKDGYSVLKELYFKDADKAIILKLIQNVSRTLVRKVGDGSTSAVIASNYLYKELKNIVKEDSCPPQDILNIANFLVDEISKLIRQNAKKATIEDLKDIAYISTNGNEEISTFIKEIYEKVGETGIIKLENSKEQETEYVLNRGIEIYRGCVDEVFYNNENEKGFLCEFKDTYVFMTDDIVTEVEYNKFVPILNYMFDINNKEVRTKNIAIIANGYDKNTLDMFRSLKKSNPQIGICLVDHAMVNQHNKDCFLDLAIFLGCVPYFKKNKINASTSDFSFGMLGYCKGFTSYYDRTAFVEGGGAIENVLLRQEDIKQKIKEIELIDDHLDRTMTLTRLKSRLASLNSTVATIYIGGDTEIEKNTKKYLIDDAVHACKSALLNGVVCGGNLTIPETMGSNYGLLIQNFKDIFGEKRLNVFIKLLHALEKSFINVYIKILDNKNISEIERNEILTKCADNNLIYNIREERYEQYEPTDNNRGFHKTNIINSCETDIEILKTVMSILGLVATSNQFVIYPLRK
jgi:chaperonin GroEL